MNSSSQTKDNTLNASNDPHATITRLTDERHQLLEELDRENLKLQHSLQTIELLKNHLATHERFSKFRVQARDEMKKAKAFEEDSKAFKKTFRPSIKKQRGEVGREYVPPDYAPSVNTAKRASLIPYEEKSVHELRPPDAVYKYRNLWKRAFRQVVFMKNLRQQQCTKYMEELNLRYLALTPTSLILSVPLFHSLDSDTIKLLASEGTTKKFLPGDRLCNCYEQPEVGYIITFGTVILQSPIRNDGDRTKLGVGDNIGITELVLEKEFDVTATAVDDVVCMKLSKESLERVRKKVRVNSAELRGKQGRSISREARELRCWVRHYVDNVVSPHPNPLSEDHHDSSFDNTVKEILLSYAPELGMEDVLERIHTILLRTLEANDVYIFEFKPLAKRLNLLVSEYGVANIRSTFIAREAVRTATTVLAHDDAAESSLKDTRMAIPVFNSSDGTITYVIEAVRFGVSEEKIYTDESLQHLQVATRQLEYYIEQKALFTKEVHNTMLNSTPLHQAEGSYNLEVFQLSIADIHKHCSISVGLYHGDQLLTPILSTCSKRGERPAAKPRRSLTATGASDNEDKFVFDFEELVEFDISIRNLPQATRLVLEVNCRGKGVVAWTGCYLFSYTHHLHKGDFTLPLIPGAPPNNFRIEGGQLDPGSSDIGILKLKNLYQDRQIRYKPLLKGMRHTPKRATRQTSTMEHLTNHDFGPRLQHLIRNPLLKQTNEDSKHIWKASDLLSSFAPVLPRFVQCINWATADQVAEAYTIIYAWERPSYLEALQLLEQQVVDPRIRAYAVTCLDALSDDRLGIFMLQLVQALKFEIFDDSSLVRFLLCRAILCPHPLGNMFYWYLRAESHDPRFKKRFEAYMQLYLNHSGVWGMVIQHSAYLMRKLEEGARAVKGKNSATEREQTLHKWIDDLLLPQAFQLPMYPTELDGVTKHGSRVLDSKKKPLLLTFTSKEEKLAVIFKAGDDLRQDQLTLQIFHVIDHLWKANSLDLCLTPYRCISTGDQVGLIEAVQDSETFASILYNQRQWSVPSGGKRKKKKDNKLYRKINAAKGALTNDAVLLEWLVNSTKGEPSVEKQFEMETGLRRNFARSCAGYCVITYVLGIGDRHLDNIMIQKTSGKMFHIDFGHFLGNFKTKLGIKRERAPFVFTPAMAAVLGNEDDDLFKEFVQMAKDGFQILRDNAALLIILFSFMTSCGLPELESEDDVNWITDTLMLDIEDEAAAKKFEEIIYQCLSTKTTQMNDAVHLLAH